MEKDVKRARQWNVFNGWISLILCLFLGSLVGGYINGFLIGNDFIEVLKADGFWIVIKLVWKGMILGMAAGYVLRKPICWFFDI